MPTEKDVKRALRKVKDPELNLDLVVLGLVYDIDIQDTHVKATMSLTSPFCPVAGQILDERLRSFEKADLREQGFVETLMPSYRDKLSEQEVRDLVGAWTGQHTTAEVVGGQPPGVAELVEAQIALDEEERVAGDRISRQVVLQEVGALRGAAAHPHAADALRGIRHI
mgnify:CR=1 FL=1